MTPVKKMLLIGFALLSLSMASFGQVAISVFLAHRRCLYTSSPCAQVTVTSGIQATGLGMETIITGFQALGFWRQKSASCGLRPGGVGMAASSFSMKVCGGRSGFLWRHLLRLRIFRLRFCRRTLDGGRSSITAL